MNSHIQQRFLSGKRFSSAPLLMLAILMLIVSCPLKRMLQSNFTSSFAAKTNQNSKAHTIHAANTSCLALKKKTAAVNANVKRHEAPPSLLLSDFRKQGFDLLYFLSGDLKKYNSFKTSAPSRLPPFLRHRRLLI